MGALLFSLGGCGDSDSDEKPKTTAPMTTTLTLSIDAPVRDLDLGGEAIAAQLRLSQAPTQEITLVLSAEPDLLTITPKQVSVSAGQTSPSSPTITIQAQDPSLKDGQVITLNVAPVAPLPEHTELSPASLDFTVRAKAQPLRAIAALTGPSQLSEVGTSTTIDVTLSAKPTAPVLLPVSVTDDQEAQADTQALTFTPDNWDSAQRITVTALDDKTKDGDTSFEVLIGPDAQGAVEGARIALTTIDGSCGNLVVDGAEQCDAPSEDQSCAYGMSSCMVCDMQCALIEGQVTGYCGDGLIQAEHGERCDGAALGELSCAQFNMRGEVSCDAMCAPDLSACQASVIQLEGGYFHTCALTSDKQVKCWGRNNNGQLGDGTQLNSASPKPITAITDAKQLAAGTFFSCALQETDGQVRCWGGNSYGQLGDHSTQARVTPVTAVRFVANQFQPITGARSIDAGYEHTCIINADAKVQCWGNNGSGQLGDDTYTSRSYALPELLSDVIQLATGSYHSCALTQDDKVYCWGRNDFGQVGAGIIGAPIKLPTQVQGLPPNIAKISAGANQSCAITQGGELYCWGDNSTGQLADGTDTASAAPKPITALMQVTQVSIGGLHLCAIDATNALYCWGGNARSQLGDGTTQARMSPTRVMGLSDVKSVTTGSAHTCALLTDDTFSCWGFNMYGSLGDGTFTSRATPSPASAL